MIIKKLKTWWQSRNYYVIADGNDNSITLSKRLFLHIKGKAKKGDAAQVFVFRIAGQDSFGFTVNPNIGQPTQLCDIQYNDKYKCIGFESLCPSVGLMLYEHGLPGDSIVKLSVSIHHTRKADIVFYSSGRIDITSHIAKQLHLSRGDVLDIMSENGELYLYVRYRSPTGGRHEACVFPSNRQGKHFRASSKRLCSAILDVSGVTDKARLCVGEPKESQYHGTLLPIITKLLL